MAWRGARDAETDQRIRRGVGRTLGSWLLGIVSFAVICGWLSTGFYYLELGEAAIILQLGKYNRTEHREGWNWHWPEPLEYETSVNTEGLRTEEFGMSHGKPPAIDEDGRPAGGEGSFANFIQTADSNIVSVSFELQYTVENPYSFVYGMAQPKQILRESTQAAVREVIGRKAVDEVLFRNRHEIEVDAQRIVEETLNSYFEPDGRHSPFAIDKINLQTVHPPAQVRAAFEDVVAAQQDETRAVSVARGDTREILERSEAQAAELREGSEAYRESKILESKGRATRFEALLAEYRRAPDVMRRRLYLETMEEILPEVEKLIVEPDTVNLLPLLPLKGAARLQPEGVGQ